MKDQRQLLRKAEDAVCRVFDELGGFEVHTRRHDRIAGLKNGLVMNVTLAGGPLDLAVEAKSRVTPQTAIALCAFMRQLQPVFVPLIYAPVISQRVAEIADENGIGYLDEAGNCRLRSARHGLLIDRRGYKPTTRRPTGVADPFSPKSSRIVRALLSQPGKGWKVLELAKHPDVGVAAGLASKVKRALVEEGYAVEHKRLLYLRDPIGLLQNWAKKYPGPAEQIPMYFRGGTEAAERAVGHWCRDHGIQHALAGYSAAWRLAPEVRYSVGAVYVDHQGFDPEVFGKLRSYQGGKRVETGANLLLWQPFDGSVFAASEPLGPESMPVTAAVQTYLDLVKLTGRGEEAATAVYEKHLKQQLTSAAERVEEMRRAEL